MEYNPDLALRDYSEYTAGRRQREECVPIKLARGKKYIFLKRGQRNYYLDGEQPLLITKGNQILSKPIASIVILEATHFKLKGETYTKGVYAVKQVFNDGKIHFDGFAKV